MYFKKCSNLQVCQLSNNFHTITVCKVDNKTNKNSNDLAVN